MLGYYNLGNMEGHIYHILLGNYNKYNDYKKYPRRHHKQNTDHYIFRKDIHNIYNKFRL